MILFDRIIERETQNEEDGNGFMDEERPSYTKLKDCLEPPTRCTNCLSKGMYEEGFKDLVSIFKEHDHDSSFKRCSGCHLVSYCSEVGIYGVLMKQYPVTIQSKW